VASGLAALAWRMTAFIPLARPPRRRRWSRSLCRNEVVATRGLDECGRLDDVVDVSGCQVDVGWITETVTRAWILVVALRESVQSLTLSPLSTGSVLVGSHAGRVGHTGLVIRIKCSALSTCSKTPWFVPPSEPTVNGLHGPNRSGRSRHGKPSSR